MLRLTPEGRLYLAENPKLRNPIDWRWIITNIIAVMAMATRAIAILLSRN